MDSANNLIQKNIDLKPHNSWKVGGHAQYFAAPKDISEVRAVLKWWMQQNIPLWILSGGSNILIQDGMVEGLVLSVRELRGVTVRDSDEVYVSCLAGTPKSDVARVFLQKKLPPAVFLTGIPGDMGGGVVMNAGIGEARVPREFCEITREIEVLRPNFSLQTVDTVILKGEQLEWVYRHSSGWQPGVIVRVDVAWENKPDPVVLQDVKQQTRKRVTTQPLELPSGGSTFRNPEGGKAAQLIDQCGLKGFRIGGAQVSMKHANFIVNDQGSTAMDIYKIIVHVRSVVEEKTGVRLQPEVVYIGKWEPFV